MLQMTRNTFQKTHKCFFSHAWTSRSSGLHCETYMRERGSRRRLHNVDQMLGQVHATSYTTLFVTLGLELRGKVVQEEHLALCVLYGIGNLPRPVQPSVLEKPAHLHQCSLVASGAAQPCISSRLPQIFRWMGSSWLLSRVGVAGKENETGTLVTA